MKRFAAVFIVCALGLALSGQAAMVGINFQDDTTAEAIAAGDTAGAPGYEQVNWNNVGRWSNPTEMNDAAGALSGVSAAWDANNTWRTSAATGNPNGQLMHGYLDASGETNDDTPPYSLWNSLNKPQVYLTGLSGLLATAGAPSYDVVLYFDGGATEGRIAEYWLQEATGGDVSNLTLGADVSPHVFGMDTENFSGTFTQVPLSADSVANAAAGNYIVFTGLTADSVLLRTEERDFRAIINGMQIIAIPEPSTFVLVGLMGLALLARRRHG